MISQPRRDCCTPVKYHQQYHPKRSHRYHDTHLNTLTAMKNKASREAPIVKKCHYSSSPNIVPTGNHDHLSVNKSNATTTIAHTNHPTHANRINTSRRITTTSGTTGIGSSSSILYYSRYTTARLRASTPNQRSPLYARQLRYTWIKKRMALKLLRIKNRVRKKGEYVIFSCDCYNDDWVVQVKST